MIKSFESEVKISTLTKKDILWGVMLCGVIGLIACSVLGFLAEGFSVPYSYMGSDDFSIINQIKQLTQEPWLWSTNRLGAPYKQEVYDYAAFFLQNTEYLMIKFWSLFTNSIPIIINVQYLCTFVLCGISAYLVLRKMSICNLLSFCGGLIYAFTPYIFGRSISHYSLSACYFVPISVYLCYLAYFSEELLLVKCKLFNRRNIMLLLACICIANNGSGYYPFFTCFLLCVAAICRFIKTRAYGDTLPAIKLIFIICISVGVSLLPTVVYHYINGVNDIALRHPGEIEKYSLKISQLFIPLYSHGIPSIQNIINEYNSNMPFVNENTMAYLGIIGCTGFILSILYLFGMKGNENYEEPIFLIARFNVASVLFMTVGGFISIFAIVTKIYVLRGFNRISIYIMFCSVAVLCMIVQQKILKMNSYIKKKIIYLVISVVTLVGIWDQTPSLYNNGTSLQAYRELWESDAAFVNEIERQLQTGDMVFQLPYHKYPETGVIHQMQDYQLLVGYIHSEALRWSYGGVKGRESDRWNEYVSQLDIHSMINTIIASGFKGIYIDTRAYTADEWENLKINIQDIISEEPYMSSNNNLAFYNLYPYIEQHVELLDNAPLTMEDIEYPLYMYGDGINLSADRYNARRYVKSGFANAEYAYSWSQGDTAELRLRLNDLSVGGDFKGTINVCNVFPESQHIQIIVNESIVFEDDIDMAGQIHFKGKAADDGRVILTFKFPNCTSPKALGQSEDSRNLALAISSIVLEKVE